MQIRALLFYFIILSCDQGVILAHDQPVHFAITLNAAASALNNSSGLNSFINSTTNSQLAKSDETNYVAFGSWLEDNIDVKGDVGGKRSLNHFYDPLDNTYGKGLSDSAGFTPFGLTGDKRELVGSNSFAWASISNCVGYNFPGEQLPFYRAGPNLNTSNIWSWQNARGYEWIGLTATNQDVRFSALTNMFRAVGQVMHLLEDASQPQHVRNEQHLDEVLGHNTPWRSPIEDYGNKYVSSLNYGDGSMLDWRRAGFAKLEDFWDRHMYNGNASALNDDAAATDPTKTLGLAEWCNGNFLGDRHIYAEYFKPGDIRYYPNPTLANTDFRAGLARVSAPARVTYLVNGKEANRIFIDKTGGGIAFSNHSVLNYLATYSAARGAYTKVSTSIRDDTVLKAYHDQLIPKAVKYSAGLLDYYFRGQIDACVVAGSDPTTLGLYVVNKSGTNLYGGTFELLSEDGSGNRTPIFTTNFTSQSLDDGAATNWDFPVPTNSPVAYMVVYQGTVGANSGGTALDPVDANIAIAAKRIAPVFPIDTNGPTPDSLVYDNPGNMGEVTVLSPYNADFVTNYYSFGNMDPGVYQVNYVEGYFSYPDGYFWTFDYSSIYNEYVSGTSLGYNREEILDNGVASYTPAGGALNNGVNYETSDDTTSTQVQTDALATNPDGGCTHMGGGPIFMQAVTLDSYHFYLDSITYQLQRVSSFYPQLNRVRIQNYATLVKPLLTMCTNCLDATGETEWDGSFNYRDLLAINYASWFADDNEGYDLAMNGKMASYVEVGYSRIFQPGVGTVPGWEISIWAQTSGDDVLIWRGYKFTGTSPVGAYYRDENDPMCADSLCCLYIESY